MKKRETVWFLTEDGGIAQMDVGGRTPSKTYGVYMAFPVKPSVEDAIGCISIMIDNLKFVPALARITAPELIFKESDGDPLNMGHDGKPIPGECYTIGLRYDTYADEYKGESVPDDDLARSAG